MIDLYSIPTDPGCYQFKDSSDIIIYIGKAKNLRKRVKSYFQKTDLDPKTQALVDNVNSVDYIITSNEIEAYILENNLIKKHQPKYNIDFKDAKRYAYIELTSEDFPRLLIARRELVTGSSFGPFVSAVARDYIINSLRRTFQIRTCKRMPKRACLRFHINLCQAPCIGNISKTKYQKNIKTIKSILKGKTNEIIKSLTNEMAVASSSLKYERALELRNQIEAIKALKEKQAMERMRKYNEDIINYVVKNERVYLILFNIYKGTLENKQEFEFEHSPDFFEEFLTQFYSENPIPKEVIIPVKIDKSLAEFLEFKRESKVKLTVPQKGEKKKLLELVKKNIEVTFFGNIEKLEDLQAKLKLQELPEVIECFDISHLSGTSTVASMVQFRSGLPDKSNYRRFKIRSVEGVDDTAAISEVVRRRYRRLQNEKAEMPNLVIIDGGSGQLNAAFKEQNKLGLRLPTIAIAKKFEEIYLPGLRTPLKLSKKTKALQLIQQVRDEAHRFAIQYHKLLRKKELIK
ncbi:excinuclease ABC subunit UvrC [[Eubacterium] cellulosolvens]